MEADKKAMSMDIIINSPTNSQNSVSDDEEIDHSVKPEFYDPTVDDKDELWALNKRKGRTSDALLSCPACFTTLSLDCQRHEKYVTRYRAVFVVNCKVGSERLVEQRKSEQKGGKRTREPAESIANPAVGETFRQVCCAVCSTEVGVVDGEEIYHFFNVLPSES